MFRPASKIKSIFCLSPVMSGGLLLPGSSAWKLPAAPPAQVNRGPVRKIGFPFDNAPNFQEMLRILVHINWRIPSKSLKSRPEKEPRDILRNN